MLRKYGVPDHRALAAIAEAAQVAVPAELVAGLPGWRTTFVGRAHEQAAVVTALGGSRLVTLVGPDGVGKTRLAVRVTEAVAEKFEAGGPYQPL